MTVYFHRQLFGFSEKMEDIIKFSWQQIDELAEKLVNTIRASRFKPDYLVGITVGGLVPLVLLAKGLDINNVITVSANSYDGNKRKALNITYLPKIDLSNKKILLVDEIVGTGETLKQISRILVDDYRVGMLKTAVMVVSKEECTFQPDFSVLEVNKWIVFPWERKESS